MVAEAVMDYLSTTVKLRPRDSLTLAPLGFNVNRNQEAAPYRAGQLTLSAFKGPRDSLTLALPGFNVNRDQNAAPYRAGQLTPSAFRSDSVL
jgi:hypothetical protein